MAGLFLLLFSLGEESTRYLLHLTRVDGGFSTHLHLRNLSNMPKEIYFQPFDEKGTALQPLALTLAGQVNMEVPASELLPANTSHARVSGSARVQVASSITASSSAETRTSQEASALLGRNYTLFPIVAAETSAFWEGVALVNPNEWPIVVELTRRDQGERSLSTQVTLGPYAKLTATFSSLFLDLEQPMSRTELSSADIFGAVALGGSQDRRFLLQAQAVLAPQFASVKQTRDDFPTLQKDPYEIRAAHAEEEILILEVTYPVTCRYGAELYYRPEFLESSPVQLNLTMVLRNDPQGPCMRVFQDAEERFDLWPIAAAYQEAYGRGGEIQLNIYDSQNQLVQQVRCNPFTHSP
jgi:hypothetical protein